MPNDGTVAELLPRLGASERLLGNMLTSTTSSQSLLRDFCAFKLRTLVSNISNLKNITGDLLTSRGGC